MNLQDFYYELPEELIAQYPSQKRSDSRLMVLHRASGEVEHRRFSEIVDFFLEGDLIVFNNTKVIKARVTGRRRTGGKLELIIFKDFSSEEVYALVKGHAKDGEVVNIEMWEAKLFRVKEGLFKVELLDGSFDEIIEKHGKLPLPPYIKRDPEPLDLERYQTVFGEVEGAVAAPTAALHFDTELIEKIKKKGVEIVYITLHVGVGTFLPVKSEKVEEHRMLPEYYEISELAAGKINAAKQMGKRAIFCGTTTVRAVESASVAGKVQAWAGKAEVFIYPGYRFQVVECMLTNFHLPQATPLFLVSALVGRDKLLNAYRIAIKERYRFFSYGDAMLII